MSEEPRLKGVPVGMRLDGATDNDAVVALVSCS